MRNNRIYIFTALICFILAACSSTDNLVTQAPVSELPQTKGRDAFAGKTFYSDEVLNKYVFGTDGSVEVYVADVEGNWLLAGKDWYSVDEENSTLYTKIITITDAFSKKVTNSPQEYENWLKKMFDQQIAASEWKFSKDSRKVFDELNSTYLGDMAKMTFDEVIEETFVFSEDEEKFTLVQKAPSYFNTHYQFISSDGIIGMDALKFSYDPQDNLAVYNGAIKNMTADSFEAEMYRIEKSINSSNEVEWTVTKAGLLKAEYETESEEVNNDLFIFKKKLHFTSIPEEMSGLKDQTLTQIVRISPADFVLLK
ncbi:hypothetical protein [Treponema sp.]|uniref:hypothetical protein n=1 Tax=Treponema sp. TaxID=166 RepID=UPI0025E26626|nr:hypothetical protein [Treponema sp.]MCR5218738.1 hypothetical protein [Treponema sp.]